MLGQRQKLVRQRQPLLLAFATIVFTMCVIVQTEAGGYRGGGGGGGGGAGGAYAAASASSYATAGVTSSASFANDLSINAINGNPFLPKFPNTAGAGIDVFVDADGTLSLETADTSEHSASLNRIVENLLKTAGSLANPNAHAAVSGIAHFGNVDQLPPCSTASCQQQACQSGNCANERPTVVSCSGSKCGKTNKQHHNEGASNPFLLSNNAGTVISQQPCNGYNCQTTQPTTPQPPNLSYVPPAPVSCRNGQCHQQQSLASANVEAGHCIGSGCAQPNFQALPLEPRRPPLPAYLINRGHPDEPLPLNSAPAQNPSGCIGSQCAPPNQRPIPQPTRPYVPPSSSVSVVCTSGNCDGPLQQQTPQPTYEPPSSSACATNLCGSPEHLPIPQPSRNIEPPNLNPQQAESPSREYIPPISNGGIQKPCASGKCVQPEQVLPAPSRSVVPPPETAAPTVPVQTLAAWHPAMNPTGHASWHPAANPSPCTSSACQPRDVEVTYVEYPGKTGSHASTGPSWNINKNVHIDAGVTGLPGLATAIGGGLSSIIGLPGSINKIALPGLAAANAASLSGSWSGSGCLTGHCGNVGGAAHSSADSAAYAYANSNAYAWSQNAA